MNYRKAAACWVQDFRWAMTAMRARAWRRRMTFSGRMKFDDALKPRVSDDEPLGPVIAYPDALYVAKRKDIERAATICMSFAIYDFAGDLSGCPCCDRSGPA